MICGVGGGLVWLIYLLFDKSLMGAFWAAAAIGVYSEMMARLVRCPATGYLLVSLLPLVPGGGIYYTMSYCVNGEREMFLQTLLTTSYQRAFHSENVTRLSVRSFFTASTTVRLSKNFHFSSFRISHLCLVLTFTKISTSAPA